MIKYHLLFEYDLKETFKGIKVLYLKLFTENISSLKYCHPPFLSIDMNINGCNSRIICNTDHRLVSF